MFLPRIFRKGVLLVMGSVALLTVLVMSTSAQTFTTDEGDKFEVSLKLDKESIMLREPTFMSFEFRSFATRDLCVGIGGDYRNDLGRPNSFKVSVVDDHGHRVAQPEVTFEGGGFTGCGIIPAGKEYVIRLYVPHWATFKETGSYQINVQRALVVGAYQKDARPSNFQANVSATLEVIPDKDEEIGELIKKLGTVMVDEGAKVGLEAATVLNTLKDKRTISHFAGALEKFQEEPEWTDENAIASKAAWALSQFDDDEAIRALEKARGSSVDDVRLDVATALSSGKHRRALGLLLSMRHDSYYFVRLRVAQRLATVNPAEAKAILYTMLDDENDDVRVAARKSLAAIEAAI